jgi:hypothetical protein
MEESSTNDNTNEEPAADDDEDDEERPIKVLIITMGGARRAALEELLLQQHDRCSSTTSRNKRIIEATFLEGVPSRELRARRSFAVHCHRAGLLPAVEWEAVRDDHDNNKGMSWEEALANVPTPVPGGRHFLLDLWHRSKALSRDRAVLACTLAHLTAMRRLVGAAEAEEESSSSSTSYDAILEDNVRWDTHTVWQTIRDIQGAKRQYDQQQQLDTTTSRTVVVHMQYFGWLGSVPNLRWMYGSHIPRHHHDIHHSIIVPFPNPQDILDDVAAGTYDTPAPVVTTVGDRHDDNRAPGGNPIWGAYGYWISSSAYETVLTRLRNDVGALLWKGKRQRRYRVKPIDKILPRLVRNHYGNTSVQLCVIPAFFRAPMLSSQIHTSFDPEFCRSTTWQLRLSAATTTTTTTTTTAEQPQPPQQHDDNDDHDDWSRLALTETERAVVAHWRDTGGWITPGQLQLLQQLQQDQPPPSPSLPLSL